MQNATNISNLKQTLLGFNTSFIAMIAVMLIVTNFQHVASAGPIDNGNDQPLLSPQEITVRLSQLLAERERLFSDLQAMFKQIEQLQNQLTDVRKLAAENMPQDMEDTPNKRQQVLEELYKKAAQRKKYLDDLEQLKAQLEKELVRLEEEVNKNNEKVKLAGELQEKEQENNELKKKIASARAELSKPQKLELKSTPMLNWSNKLEAEYLVVLAGKVAPLEQPYYNVIGIRLGSRVVARVTKESDGETIDQARASDSTFSKFVKRIDREKQYVVVIVESSSFGTFREVRKLLRDHAIKVGWMPQDGEPPWIFGVGKTIGDQ